MGIVHYAGLGRSAGAVTAGLSYNLHRFGGRDTEYGAPVESVVLFTSPEVVSGDMQAFPAAHNEYMNIQTRQQWAKNKKNAVDIVAGFLSKAAPEATLEVVEVDVNNFDTCFEAVACATLRGHRPEKVGKHIWANITGGSNLLNAALFQVASLSGMINRLYYTFVADIHQNGQYLQPFSPDPTQFRYGETFTLHTQFGARHQRVLEVLEQVEKESPGRFVSSDEFMSRLKNDASLLFEGLDKAVLIRDFLNVMQGIKRLGDRAQGQQNGVRISSDGQQMLDLLRRPLWQALVQRHELDAITVDELVAPLKITRIRS